MPFAHENRGRQYYRFVEAVLARWPRLTRKSWILSGAAVLLVLICFLAGSWYGHRQAAKAGAGGRPILYYVDPMNPAHTSPEPGLAPCGMKLEPVYADEVGQYPDSALAPGTVRVTPRKQQLIGVRLATVEKAPFTYTLRALGKVAVDERLIYRLNASLDGWIRKVGNNSTGSVVQKGETLAIFYSPEFLASQQAYIYALSALDRFQATGNETPAQIQLTRANIQQYVDSLRNLGMSDQQVLELEKTRQYTENIRMVAPATSFVLARNISAGQRFDKGTEWYRLADLSRVWVLVDLYENEADYIKPGEKVRVSQPYQKKVVEGVVSDVLPQFDPASRTLKVRLEVANPDFALRPDMFMDVDFPVIWPETISVPADAVLDSGLRQTVFVDRGEGFFEPRSVQTGWRLGGRVQILKGLQPGEKIVVSGNFLIDSESRMKLAAAGLMGDIGSDIVCGKLVDERQAEAEGRSSQHLGKAYFFCSEACKQQFDQDPGRYVGPAPVSPAAAPRPPATASATPPVPPAALESIVASPPPGWQAPVIPPAPSMPMAAPPSAPPTPMTAPPTAGAPVITHPPADGMPVVVHPQPGSGTPPGLNLPSVADQSLAPQLPANPGPAATGAAPPGPERHEPPGKGACTSSHRLQVRLYPRAPSRLAPRAVGNLDMINRVIDFSVHNKVIVFIIVAAACLAGWWSMQHLTLDAIPDLSDTQVIIYSRWDRSPDIIEDQVTYPIVSAMLGAPQVKTVRGFSDFGYSYVYVIFEDGTDIYWARSRTLEYLSGVLPRLPAGVRTELGPDATGLGWVFQYALVDESGDHSLEQMRSFQDWYFRYYLKAVPGVAEVAPVGGFTKQYQVNLDPNRLQAYGISTSRVVKAVQGGNKDVGGRLIEFGGTEYMVRGRGYARTLQDFENIVLTASDDGTPIRVKDVGQVGLGPDLRRGVVDLDGTGEVVSGIVVMRQGQNALDVIQRVKAKLKEIEPGLPQGVKLVPIYDRSELIQRSIDNMKSTLVEVLVTVSLVILIFLWHLPSALIPIITIPVAILISFLPFRLLGVTANIMSLGGIVIAVGAMVDAAIVVVEQSHKQLEVWDRTGRREDYRTVIVNAVKQVAGPSFFALLVIAVAFLPVLTLEAQEGRMFKPLAYTKNLSMIVAAVLAITLDPALRLLFTHLKNFNFRPAWLCRAANAVLVGSIHAEEKHPISRGLIRLYEPVVTWSLRRKWAIIGGALVLVILTIPAYLRIGSEFMPPLEEGSILYMPSTMPGISLTEAQKLLQVTDRIIKQFPEVDRVLGKAGRAETSTDPAPLSMLETVIILRPKSEWRRVDTWYSAWAPEWLQAILRPLSPDRLTQDELISQMNEALKLPGLANGWTMPIKGRIEMLSTGLRTPIGIKISGNDLKTIEAIGTRIESVLPTVKGTRSVFAERTGSGYFLDFTWDRNQLARYGLSIDEVQEVIQSAIGGDNVTTTVEGRERYGVSVRYQRDFRSDYGALGRILVSASDGKKQIPLSQLASITAVSGPAMIRDEDGLLTGYVYIDLADRDPGGYVTEAAEVLKNHVTLPPGYSISWSGQYEAAQRVKQRLLMVIPLTLFLIFLLLFMNTRSITKTMIILLAVPFSAIGAIWFLYILGYNMSIAVWVGLIALLGVDAETGVFMLLYLDLAYEQARKEGRLGSLADLHQTIVEGAAKRIRPKFMTTATMFLGLIPVMWSTGAGADIMKRIAAPMIGGIFTSFLLELLVYPSIYEIWKWNYEIKKKVS